MRDFIERLRAKPEHIRRRVAFFSSASITGVVGLAWLAATVNTGAFALANPQPGTPLKTESTASANDSTLIGAAAAFSGGQEKGGITVENVKPEKPVPAQDSRTVIPF